MDDKDKLLESLVELRIVRWTYVRIRRGKSLFFLLKKCLDLLQTFFIFGNVKIFLDDSNKHIEDNHCDQVNTEVQSLKLYNLQLAKMNQRMQKEAPIHAMPLDS
jgi:hypothetical protein